MLTSERSNKSAIWGQQLSPGENCFELGEKSTLHKYLGQEEKNVLAAYLLQDVSPLDTWRSKKALNAKNPRYPWYLGSTSFMCFDSSSSGVSQYKQAFSTDDGNLLVRRKPCACSACIDMEWENCALKVKLVFSQIFCDLTVPLCRTMSTSLLLFSWSRKAARRRFKLFEFVFFTSLISPGEWAGASACADARGGRVEPMSGTGCILWCKVF